ncbi:hypothetical protein C806_00117 [Lachnospiraceae bacterium 3-1]|nr:hypothetical protein C806_00117 [Lachnospiraceae bacterium 3-1]
MIREVDLISYLPEYLHGYQELEKIMAVQQVEIQALEDITEVFKNNQFILSADEQGIKKYEIMLGVTALDDDTLENRKFRVLSRWNNTIPYTVFTLKEKLENLCGKDGYILEALNEEYRVFVRVALTSKKNYRMVEEMLNEVIPANMIVDLSLLYNQHSTLGKFTNRQLAMYTQNQIRNEVLVNGD